MLLCSATLFGQKKDNTNQCDVIILTTNDSLQVRIVEMTKHDIHYKVCGGDSGKLQTISRSKVLKIKHPDNSYIIINTPLPIPDNVPVKKIKTVSCDTIQGQFYLTIGLGDSPFFNQTAGFGEYVPYPVATQPDSYHESGVKNYSKEICGAFDYRVKKRISLGLAMSYQNENIEQTGGYVIDKISRMNISARILGYLKTRDEHLIFYSGIRAGCSFWNDNCSQQGDWYIKAPSLILPSFQVLFGTTLFPISFLGINAEIGIGSPYLFEYGLAYRFNNKKRI